MAKDNPVLFKSVTEVEIRQDGNAYQLENAKYTGERLMSFQVTDGESKGELFTGRWKNPNKYNVQYRYKDGVVYTGYGLGTEKTPNLYYYYKGLYQKVIGHREEKNRGGLGRQEVPDQDQVHNG